MGESLRTYHEFRYAEVLVTVLNMGNRWNHLQILWNIDPLSSYIQVRLWIHQMAPDKVHRLDDLDSWHDRE